MFTVKSSVNILFIIVTGGVTVMDYTKRLYDLRIDNDLKQEDVANVLKITKQAYGMYENKKRSLPIESLIVLCKFYNVSSDYILGLTDDMESKKE